jgi:hypothetical protein
MGIEFFIIVWFWSMQNPDGRVGKYHSTDYPQKRYKRLEECEFDAKQRVNKWPRENTISPDGTELRYADFHCIDVKRLGTGAVDAYATTVPQNHPLPPKRPNNL